MLWIPHALLLLVLGLVSFSRMTSQASRIPVNFDSVAYTGIPAPGTTNNFSTFDEVVTNDQGDVLFQGTTNTTRRGVWKRPLNGPVEALALQNDPVPGIPGATFNQFNELNLNENGTAAFIASMFGVGGRENEAIFVEDGQGGLRIATREDDQAPLSGEPGPRFMIRPRLTPVSGQRGFLLNDEDEIAFHSNTVSDVGLSNGTGVFAEDAGTLETNVISTYPGFSPAPITVVAENPTFNNDGNVAVFVDGDDPAQVLPNGPEEDSLAPSAGGALFLAFGGPVINATGELAFTATLKNPPGTSNLVSGTNSTAIYTTAGGGLTLVARAGSSAPGTAFSFAALSSAPVLISDRGDVVFQGSLVGAPNNADTGIWSLSPGGTLRKVFLEGDPAPRVSGFELGLGGAVTATENLVVNASGHIAFLALLREINGPAQDIGLYAEINGQLELITKTGDTFELAPGDFRTITNTSGLGIQFFGGTGNGDGRRSGFNNNDQAVVRLEFSGSPGGQAVVLLDDFLLSLAAHQSQPQYQLLSFEFEFPAVQFNAIPGVGYRVQTSTTLPTSGYSTVHTVPAGNTSQVISQPLPDLFTFPRGFTRIQTFRPGPGP